MGLIRCHPLFVRYASALTIQWMLPHMVTLAYAMIKYSFHSPEYYKFMEWQRIWRCQQCCTNWMQDINFIQDILLQLSLSNTDISV